MACADSTRCTITGVSKMRSLTKISQALESTFQRDYGPILSDRLQPSTRPPPADVIPKHPCYSKPQDSTTRDTYRGTRAQAARADNRTSCFETHFKMGETGCTRLADGSSSTQRETYKPVTGNAISLRAEFEPKSHLMQTTGNTGNLLGTMMQKAEGSEYNDTYCGACSATSSELPGSTPQASSITARNTITGEMPDVSTSRVALSLQSTQRGDYVWPPLIHHLQEARKTAFRQRHSDIPQGDASKIPIPPTNHQEDYTAHVPIPSSMNYTSRRAQALAQIHGCSIQPCDPHINPFQPSALPQPSNLFLDHLPAAGHAPMILQSDMTTSHFPQGDLNADRVGERINYSTTQQSHRPPPPGFYPKHVQGAHMRALSHFQVGCPSYQPQLRWTTMNAGYQPTTNIQHFVRSPPKDNITFRYPNKGHYQTSSGSTHQPLTGTPKTKLNPTVLQNLKQSHWHHPDPHSSQDAYSTTHRTAFQLLPPHPAPPPTPPTRDSAITTT